MEYLTPLFFQTLQLARGFVSLLDVLGSDVSEFLPNDSVEPMVEE